MTIIVNGSELSTGWMVALGIIGAVLILMLALFIGVVWQAASKASDWLDRENSRYRAETDTTPNDLR